MKGDSMNKFIGIGRLTADPEVRYSGEMPIASFNVAIDRKYKRDGEPTADFLKCTAFKGQAEFIEKYFRKGQRIAFVGHIQTGSYTNKEGQKVYTTSIIIDEVEFVESKNTNQGLEQTALESTSNNGFVNIPDGIDTELPFN